jgi:hypothetical protein
MFAFRARIDAKFPSSVMEVTGTSGLFIEPTDMPAALMSFQNVTSYPLDTSPLITTP